MVVNYGYMEIAYEDEKKKKITYKHRWITNKEETEENVMLRAKCGRVQRKLVNEHNSVLKNYGYNFEDNFGRGEGHTSELFCVLTVVGFLYQGIVGLADEAYQRACALVGWWTEFFD